MSSTAMPPSDKEPQGGFVALMRHRNYGLLWTGQLISQVGDRFHWVAISLWVYAQTGSALSVSYAITALLVAPALVGFYAGALVDRLDRRRILITADLVRAGLVAAIPWLMQQGIAWVYLDLFLISAASAFFRPAMFAAIPQSVPRPRLLQANAYFATMDSSTEVFGPALAGLVVARFGYATAMYIDAASYLVSALFVSGLSLPAPERSPDDAGATGRPGTMQSIREGLRYIRRDRMQVALLGFLLAGFWVAGLNSLQTPLAKGVLGVTDEQFGWFQSVWGIGFIGASLLLGWYGGRLPKGHAIVFAYLLWAAAAGIMGLSPNYGVLVVTGFWVGFANMLLFVNVSTVLMEHTPPDKIGRVITTRQVMVALIRVAALVGFGWLADQTGVRLAILVMAGISFVGTLAATVRYPEMWRYRSPVMARPPEVAPVARVTFGTLNRYLEARTDAEFVVSEQRWLNLASLLIVGVGWAALLIIMPAQALGVAASIAGAVGLAGLVRAAAGRLKPVLEERERRGPALSLGAGRRKNEMGGE